MTERGDAPTSSGAEIAAADDALDLSASRLDELLNAEMASPNNSSRDTAAANDTPNAGNADDDDGYDNDDGAASRYGYDNNYNGADAPAANTHNNNNDYGDDTGTLGPDEYYEVYEMGAATSRGGVHVEAEAEPEAEPDVDGELEEEAARASAAATTTTTASTSTITGTGTGTAAVMGGEDGGEQDLEYILDKDFEDKIRRKNDNPEGEGGAAPGSGSGLDGSSYLSDAVSPTQHSECSSLLSGGTQNSSSARRLENLQQSCNLAATFDVQTSVMADNTNPPTPFTPSSGITSPLSTSLVITKRENELHVDPVLEALSKQAHKYYEMLMKTATTLHYALSECETLYERVDKLRTANKKIAAANVHRSTHIPGRSYFLDKLGKEPPPNLDAIHQAANQVPTPESIAQWGEKDSALLYTAVKKQQLTLMTEEITYTKYNIGEGTTPEESARWNLELLALRNIPDEKLLSCIHPKFDWNEVQSAVPSHSVAECKRRWMNVQSPTINKNPFTKEEDIRLLQLAKKYNAHDWDLIAAELGGGRQAYQCLARYQRSLNSQSLHSKWTAAEDEILKRSVATYGEKDWQRVASLLPGRNGQQCLHRWLKSLKPSLKQGHWNDEEDIRLMIASHYYGPKRWAKIAHHVPNRSDVKCRERWKNVLDPSLILSSVWTPEEDKMLLDLYHKYGEKWSLIASKIPCRTDNQCWRRWKAISPDPELESYQHKVRRKMTVLPRNFVGRECERSLLTLDDIEDDLESVGSEISSTPTSNDKGEDGNVAKSKPARGRPRKRRVSSTSQETPQVAESSQTSTQPSQLSQLSQLAPSQTGAVAAPSNIPPQLTQSQVPAQQIALIPATSPHQLAPSPIVAQQQLQPQQQPQQQTDSQPPKRTKRPYVRRKPLPERPPKQPRTARRRKNSQDAPPSPQTPLPLPQQVQQHQQQVHQQQPQPLPLQPPQYPPVQIQQVQQQPPPDTMLSSLSQRP
ncbi:myb transcription factor [Pelomyxa schiedti]|nr:myb transcription factor [Pelomyxa schiedti]